MHTETRSKHASAGREPNRRATDVLIVGTLGGGGIHHYVEEQATRLPDSLSVRVYDMASDSRGQGVVWFVTSVLRSLWAIVRFPFRPPPDVVHVHTSHRFSFYRASFYVLFAAFVWRRPVLLHIHGSSFDDFARTNNPAVRWLQSLVFGVVEHVIVLSDYWREVLGSHVSEDKLQVLPNAVDPDAFDPAFGSDPPHFVFVSNLVERKGVRELIEAIDLLRSRDVKFQVTIAGDGPLADEVSALAARNDDVEYAGYVSESRKRELLSSGSVFVLPTHAEGLPIAMLEGMAGGNAIVSTAVGSIPEVIDDERGIIVEPGDPEALADSLEKLASSPELAERMAQRNRALIESEYSWDRTTDHLERLYEATARTMVDGVDGTPG